MIHHATYHKMAAWLRPLGKRGLGLVTVMLWLSGALMGQEINISDAVISIPEGVSLSTDGGITLEHDGRIDLSGQIQLGGDWTNDGKGLVERSRGEVVFSGKDQRIGGRFATQFHHLRIAQKGALELKCAIAVTGDFNLQSGILITNFNAITFGGQGRMIDNGAVCRIIGERSGQICGGETEIAQAGNARAIFQGLAASSGGGVAGPQVRVRGGKSTAKGANLRAYPGSRESNYAVAKCPGQPKAPTGAFHQAAIVTMQAHAAGLSDGDGITEADCRASQVVAFGVCGPRGCAHTSQTRKQDSGPAFASSFLAFEFSRIISC